MSRGFGIQLLSISMVNLSGSHYQKHKLFLFIVIKTKQYLTLGIYDVNYSQHIILNIICFYNFGYKSKWYTIVTCQCCWYVKWLLVRILVWKQVWLCVCVCICICLCIEYQIVILINSKVIPWYVVRYLLRLIPPLEDSSCILYEHIKCITFKCLPLIYYIWVTKRKKKDI